jgi:hypothetical protein
MNGSLFAASGIDANEGAQNAFVWYHDKISNKYLFLGSGHVMGASDTQPVAATYTVRFLLPHGYSPANIVVTDDTSANGVLPGVTVSPLSASGLLPSGTAVISDGYLGSAGGHVGPGRAAAPDFSRLGNAQESET